MPARKNEVYDRSPKKQQRVNGLKNDESKPTEELLELNKIQETFQPANFPKVPVEESVVEKVIIWFQKWGAIFGIISAIVGSTTWILYLKYDIDAAKNDIEENTKEIKKDNGRILELDKAQVGHDKEIIFLKKAQDSTDTKLLKIEDSLKGMEIEQARQNGSMKKK